STRTPCSGPAMTVSFRTFAGSLAASASGRGVGDRLVFLRDAGPDVGERFFHLVHQDQAEVAGPDARQRDVNGAELALHLDDLAARPVAQPFAQQRHHLAIGPAALALVLVQDEVVEAGCEQRRLAPDVLVTAVAGAADHDAAPAGFHRAHGLHQGAHG